MCERGPSLYTRALLVLGIVDAAAPLQNCGILLHAGSLEGDSPPKQEQAFEHAISGNASKRLEPNKQEKGTVRAQLLDSPANGEQAAGGRGEGAGGGQVQSVSQAQ